MHVISREKKKEETPTKGGDLIGGEVSNRGELELPRKRAPWVVTFFYWEDSAWYTYIRELQKKIIHASRSQSGTTTVWTRRRKPESVKEEIGRRSAPSLRCGSCGAQRVAGIHRKLIWWIFSSRKIHSGLTAGFLASETVFGRALLTSARARRNKHQHLEG